MPIHLLRALLLPLLCLMSLSSTHAQSSTTRKWGHTELDSVVSVSTPYRGEPGQDAAAPWFAMFVAPGHYNRFVMVRMDMKSMAQATSQVAGSAGLMLDIDKFLRRVIKTNFLQFSKVHLDHEYVVSLPTKTNSSAMHRSYSGVDDVSQELATMDVTWFEQAQVVYLFFCTTVAPNDPVALEEKQRYFSSIVIQH